MHEKDALWMLLQFSLYEESATDGNDLNQQGFFDYPWFDLYFTEDDRQAFFLWDEDASCLVGFAMINTYMHRAGEGHSMAEFMVLPKYRRQGAGKQAAMRCFALHPGRWEVAPALAAKALSSSGAM